MSGNRTILHVDMDAFFAAVEQLDRPELRGLPVIVGSAPDERGVVSTCSYEARKYGVHSAMPSRTAYRLCPQGIFVPPRMARYAEVAEEIRAVFDQYTPLVEPVSIDEAFLDLTGATHLFGDGETAARRLQAHLRAATQLSASVGVAANKFLAKVASDLHKPNGLTVVPRDPAGAAAFLAPLPVRRLWGVGEKTESVLARASLRTIGDLQNAAPALLTRLLGEHSAASLRALAFGQDERPVEPHGEEKSISGEHTFGTDCSDWAEVERVLLHEVARVGRRLRLGDKIATTAHLKLRWASFTTLTRQCGLPLPTNSERLLRTAALELLTAARTPQPVRLVGFGVTGLQAATAPTAGPLQPDLFTVAPVVDTAKDDRVDRALDTIQERFGRASIRRGLD